MPCHAMYINTCDVMKICSTHKPVLESRINYGRMPFLLFFFSYFSNHSDRVLLNQFVGQSQSPTCKGKVHGRKESKKGSRGKREGSKGNSVRIGKDRRSERQ
jgi:hypothetical protein